MADENTYGLELKGDGPASFMAGGEAVELNAGEVFETTDARAYYQLRGLPFLNDLGVLRTRSTESAADIRARITSASDDELASFADDDRKTVAAAAAAELERRAAGGSPDVVAPAEQEVES